MGPKISSRPPSTSNNIASEGASGIHPCAAWVMAAWKSKILLSALNGNMTTRQSRAMKARNWSWVMARSVAGGRLRSQQKGKGRGGRWLFFDQPYGVAVGITDHDCLLEAELSLRRLRNGHHVGRDELRTRCAPRVGDRADVFGDQCRLPMPEIAGLGVAGHRSA